MDSIISRPICKSIHTADGRVIWGIVIIMAPTPHVLSFGKGYTKQ